MKTKEWLLQRKKELQEELVKYAELTLELNEVEKALKGLEPPPTCKGCSDGCNECRTGWRYR